MKKTDMRDILSLVKQKLSREARAACGLFWSDAPVTADYAVGEISATTDYSVGEEDTSILYRDSD